MTCSPIRGQYYCYMWPIRGQYWVIPGLCGGCPWPAAGPGCGGGAPRADSPSSWSPHSQWSLVISSGGRFWSHYPLPLVDLIFDIIIQLYQCTKPWEDLCYCLTWHLLSKYQLCCVSYQLCSGCVIVNKQLCCDCSLQSSSIFTFRGNFMFNI